MPYSQLSPSINQESPVKLFAKDGVSLTTGHAVEDETDGVYTIDGVPVTRARDTIKKQSRHVTMIDDNVLDEVAFTCGMAATGLYAVLERRVGRDGTWTCRIADLGAAFDQNDRHVRAAIGVLEEAGFLYRETVYGRGGVPSGVRFTLPKHMRTYDPVVTPEADPEPTPVVHPEVTPEPHAPVQGVVITSTNQVDTSNGDTPPNPPAAATPKPVDPKPKQTKTDEYPAEVQAFWDACTKKARNRATKDEVLAEWRKINPDPETVEQIMTSLHAWNQTDDFVRGFAQGAQRFLKSGKWKQIPDLDDIAENGDQGVNPIDDWAERKKAELRQKAGRDNIIETTGVVTR